MNVWRFVAAALLLVMTGGCSETAYEHARMVVPRPDGVLVIYEKSWSRERFRMPMDHGASSVETAEVHQAFFYPADGGEPRAVPLDLVVDYENQEPGLSPDFPVLSWRRDALVAELCRNGPDMTLDCFGVPGGNIRQVQARIEEVALTGDQLVLARGPDGSADCAIDLSSLSNSLTERDWVLAHYPNQGTYLFDQSDPALSLYRLQCGQVPQLLETLAVEGAEWTEVYDVVPGADPANPLVLYSSHDRFQQAIVRNMAGDVVALETGAVEKGDTFFLDASGETIVLDDDAFLRQTPGLRLTLYEVASGERRTLAWDHAFAPWPDRP